MAAAKNSVGEESVNYLNYGAIHLTLANHLCARQIGAACWLNRKFAFISCSPVRVELITSRAALGSIKIATQPFVTFLTPTQLG